VGDKVSVLCVCGSGWSSGGGEGWEVRCKCYAHIGVRMGLWW